MIQKLLTYFTPNDCAIDTKPIQLAPAEHQNKELPQQTRQVDVVQNKKPQVCVPKYKDAELQNLVDVVIQPYLAYFVGQNAFDGVCRLLELLDLYGSCPSITEVSRGKNTDDELRALKNVLSLVSLTSHTCGVVKNAIKLLKAEYRHDHENMVPLILVMALAHDIGKIPALRAENCNYTMSDHVVISSSKVVEILGGNKVHWINKVVDAINNHHRAGGDQFSAMLRQADSDARQSEVAEISKMVSSKDWAEWYDIHDFLSMIKPHINNIKSGNNKWYAFSYGGIVYCRPDLIYKTAQKLAKAKNVIDMSLILPLNKKDVLIKIVDRLRESDMLASDVAKGYFGKHYEIIWQVRKHALKSEVRMKMYLLPLKIEVFRVPPSEIERCKNGTYLRMISQIRSAKGSPG